MIEAIPTPTLPFFFRVTLPGVWRALASCLPAILWALPSPGAEYGTDLAVETWSVEEGLPNSTVTAITQTKDGYLWIGTFSGLARFDGVRFVNFNPDNTPALKHARIQRLEVDANDTLWINAYDGSLISFRDGVFTEEWKGGLGRAEKISLVPSRGGEIIFALETGDLLRRPLNASGPGNWRVLRPPVELRENAIYCEDQEGALWCLTRDKRVWRIHNDEYQLIASEETLGSRPRRMVPDSTGVLWLVTGSDIFRWDGSRFVPYGPTDPGDLAQHLRFLFFPREGGGWLIADGRFRKFEDRQWIGEIAQWKNQLGPDYPIYQQMHQDRKGGLWFAPPHRGVFHLTPDGIPTQLGTKDGLPSDFITSWFEDREGNIWLGAERGGLIRLREKRFHTLALEGNPPPAAAMSVCEDLEGTMWVGTFGHGLLRSKEERAEQFFASKDPPGRYVFSVVPDLDGRIWASARNEDLHMFADGKMQVAPWSAHGIKAMFVDRRGRLWVGTKEQLFRASEGKLEISNVFDHLSRHEVRVITEDRSDNLWIGVGGGTLYRYDGRDRVAFKPTDTSVLHPIWSLSPDDDGSLWIGTFGGGLLRFKDGQFSRYTRKSGLPDNVICQILDDGNGHLWLGSHQGVFRVSKDSLDAFSRGTITTVPSLIFGRHDGLPSAECTGGYQPSAWRRRDGTLWFATAGGVASIDPSRLDANPAPPSVTIESVIVDGGFQPAFTQTRERAPSSRDAQIARVLEVPAGGKYLEFQYTGICFASPDDVRFRYKLEGLDNAWTEAGRRRFVQYSHLRPGSYRFLVSACNSDGVWNEIGASLALKVLPHFWETWWFLGLLGVTMFGSIGATVHHLSTRRLQRRLQGLERRRAVEEERARIARDMHDDLGAGLTQITLFSELLRRAPPDRVDEHLTQISETADSLTRAMDEIVWAVNPQNDTLESLISYICSFAQEYLRSANVKCRLEMPAHVPTTCLSSEIRHNLFVSIKETLNNILKHAQASEVWLRLALQTENLSLTVEDDGRGMTEGEISAARHGGGQGLVNLQARMASIGGSCSFSAGTGGRGIRVTLKVPLRGEPARDD